jgi:hypothetical protein
LQFAAKVCEGLLRGAAGGGQLDMYRFNSLIKAFRALIADACYGAGSLHVSRVSSRALFFRFKADAFVAHRVTWAFTHDHAWYMDGIFMLRVLFCKCVRGVFME